MKKITFLLLALSLIFSACQKDDPAPVDHRTQFIGTFTGNQTIVTTNGSSFNTDNSTVTRTILNGDSESEIIIYGILGESVTAEVSENQFTIHVQKVTAHVGSLTHEYTVTGTGKFEANGNLGLAYTARNTMNGETYLSTITESLDKE
ncbi:hypothetical protein ACRTDU_03985 [Sunxiuqinia elliptica]